jgi:hypothetical protein
MFRSPWRGHVSVAPCDSVTPVMCDRLCCCVGALYRRECGLNGRPVVDATIPGMLPKHLAHQFWVKWLVRAQRFLMHGISWLSITAGGLVAISPARASEACCWALLLWRILCTSFGLGFISQIGSQDWQWPYTTGKGRACWSLASAQRVTISIRHSPNMIGGLGILELPMTIGWQPPSCSDRHFSLLRPLHSSHHRAHCGYSITQTGGPEYGQHHAHHN